MTRANTSQTLVEIKALLEANRDADKEWKEAMLAQFKALNGTVHEHTTEIAVLKQSDVRQEADVKQACERVRSVELSQAKSAGIGAIFGAIIAGLPQIITAARALLARP